MNPVLLKSKDVFFKNQNIPVTIELRKLHPVYRLHYHFDFEELAIVNNGVGIYQRKDKFSIIAPGDVIYADSQDPHGYVEVHQMTLFNIVFSIEGSCYESKEIINLINILKDLSNKNNASLISKPNSLQKILIAITQIENENFKNIDGITIISILSLFMRILVIIARDSSKQISESLPKKQNTNKALEKLMITVSLIRENSNESINDLIVILKDKNLYTKSIQRYFLQYCELSLYKFILLQKLVDTMNYIVKYPNKSISAIVLDLNYSSFRTFSRQVLSFFNLSPQQFKKYTMELVNLNSLSLGSYDDLSEKEKKIFNFKYKY